MHKIAQLSASSFVRRLILKISFYLLCIVENNLLVWGRFQLWNDRFHKYPLHWTQNNESKTRIRDETSCTFSLSPRKPSFAKYLKLLAFPNTIAQTIGTRSGNPLYLHYYSDLAPSNYHFFWAQDHFLQSKIFNSHFPTSSAFHDFIYQHLFFELLCCH